MKLHFLSLGAKLHYITASEGFQLQRSCYMFSVRKNKLKVPDQSRRLTCDGADVIVVVAAAVTGHAVLITSAAGDVAIIGLVASISTGCVWDD